MKTEKYFSEIEMKFVRTYTIMQKSRGKQYSYHVIFIYCITIKHEELIRIDNSKVSKKVSQMSILAFKLIGFV
jgi:hypothetical protein